MLLLEGPLGGKTKRKKEDWRALLRVSMGASSLLFFFLSPPHWRRFSWAPLFPSLSFSSFSARYCLFLPSSPELSVARDYTTLFWLRVYVPYCTVCVCTRPLYSYCATTHTHTRPRSYCGALHCTPPRSCSLFLLLSFFLSVHIHAYCYVR